MEYRFCCGTINSHEANKYENYQLCDLCVKNQLSSREELPNFKCGQTEYTKCDYMLERNVHENILKLEELFKEYEKLCEQELKMQKELLDSMWLYAQRYLILTGGVCVKPYPEIISLRAEENELCKFNTCLKKIKRSNCLLDQSMAIIRTSYSGLLDLCKQLDTNVESPFINGNFSLNSVFYVRNILNDLFNYFNDNLCKMISMSKFLDIKDCVSIENYLNFITVL